MPNRNGLYDTSGSVLEWVQDVYDYELPGGKDPLVTSFGWFFGFNRVLRDGGWNFEAWALRSANRDGFGPGRRYRDTGFRLLRTL